MGLRRLTETQQQAAETMAFSKLAGGQGRTSVVADVRTWLMLWHKFLPRPALERARKIVKKIEDDRKTWG